MISERKIKFDVLGQTVLLGAIILLWWYFQNFAWTNAMIVLLGLWQMASAYHLYLSYKYISKKGFIKTFLIVLVSLPVWYYFFGIWSYIPVGGLLVCYFIWSIRDLIIIHQRPRSFWDL